MTDEEAVAILRRFVDEPWTIEDHHGWDIVRPAVEYAIRRLEE